MLWQRPMPLVAAVFPPRRAGQVGVDGREVVHGVGAQHAPQLCLEETEHTNAHAEYERIATVSLKKSAEKKQQVR